MSRFIKTVIGKPEQWLINNAASIGLDFSNLIHEITSELISHSMKRHGNPKIHGAATITEIDFKRIPDIVKTPDYAIIGAIRKETLLNLYAKIFNDITFMYFEEVLISRRNKALRGKTLYKITRALSIEDIMKNLTKNNKTDISKAKVVDMKNVQTAGGYPGG